jgi:hypothetical protein
MKACLLTLVIVFSLFFFACSNTTSSSSGFLTITNHSSGIASVSVGSSSFDIQPNSSYTKTIDTGKSTTVHISYSGDYIDSGNDTVEVSPDHTSTYDLYADCGRLRINNNSDNTLYITFTGKATYNLNANSYDTYKIFLGSASSGSTSFDYEGLYVFADNETDNIYVDEQTTTTINADAGAININNNSSFTITHVYLSPSSQSSWGTDALTGNVYSGNSAIWTTGQGHWDVKVVNDFGDTIYIYDKYVVTNETLNLNIVNRNTVWTKVDRKLPGIGNFKPAHQFVIRNK